MCHTSGSSRGSTLAYVPLACCHCTLEITFAMQLYYTPPQSQRLARIYVSGDSVKVELSQRAMQAHLADVCILCASIFLSGRNID